MSTEAPSQTQPRPTRRNFIVWWLASILGAFSAAFLLPILVYIWPPAAKGQKNQDIPVNLDKALSQLKDGDAAKFEAPKGTGFILQTGGGNNHPGDLAFAGYASKANGQVNVLAVTCSHLGCSVALNQQGKRFDCPCHGSQFALNGDVLHGPATAPLSQLKWQQGSSPTQIKVYGLNLGERG